MIRNLNKSLNLNSQSSKAFDAKKASFCQQKYFLDVSKCDEAVKKLNSALAAISARVINGKYMPKFDFKRKTANTSMASIKRTSTVNSDSGRDSPLIPKKGLSKQRSLL